MRHCLGREQLDEGTKEVQGEKGPHSGRRGLRYPLPLQRIVYSRKKRSLTGPIYAVALLARNGRVPPKYH